MPDKAAFDRESGALGVTQTKPGTYGIRHDEQFLRQAEQAGAIVVSNDRFVPYVAEHTWLREPGRLYCALYLLGWRFDPRVAGKAPRKSPATPAKATKPTTKAGTPAAVGKASPATPVKATKAPAASVTANPAAGAAKPVALVADLAGHERPEQVKRIRERVGAQAGKFAGLRGVILALLEDDDAADMLEHPGIPTNELGGLVRIAGLSLTTQLTKALSAPEVLAGTGLRLYHDILSSHTVIRVERVAAARAADAIAGRDPTHSAVTAYVDWAIREPTVAIDALDRPSAAKLVDWVALYQLAGGHMAPGDESLVRDELERRGARIVDGLIELDTDILGRWPAGHRADTKNAHQLRGGAAKPQGEATEQTDTDNPAVGTGGDTPASGRVGAPVGLVRATPAQAAAAYAFQDRLAARPEPAASARAVILEALDDPALHGFFDQPGIPTNLIGAWMTAARVRVKGLAKTLSDPATLDGTALYVHPTSKSVSVVRIARPLRDRAREHLAQVTPADVVAEYVTWALQEPLLVPAGGSVFNGWVTLLRKAAPPALLEPIASPAAAVRAELSRRPGVSIVDGLVHITGSSSSSAQPGTANADDASGEPQPSWAPPSITSEPATGWAAPTTAATASEALEPAQRRALHTSVSARLHAHAPMTPAAFLDLLAGDPDVTALTGDSQRIAFVNVIEWGTAAGLWDQLRGDELMKWLFEHGAARRGFYADRTPGRSGLGKYDAANLPAGPTAWMLKIAAPLTAWTADQGGVPSTLATRWAMLLRFLTVWPPSQAPLDDPAGIDVKYLAGYLDYALDGDTRLYATLPKRSNRTRVLREAAASAGLAYDGGIVRRPVTT